MHGVRNGVQLMWRPKPWDWVMAGSVCVLGLYEAAFPGRPDVQQDLQALLTVLWSGALVVRRRWPIPVLVLILILGPSYNALTDNGGVLSYVLAMFGASYAVGRELDRPRTWWGPVLNVGFICVYSTATYGFILSDYFFAATFYGGAWAAGFAIRRREKRVEELAAEAVELQSHHQVRERQLVSEERARMARELHDIVAHSLSAITVQTQAVRRRLGVENKAEAEDLLGIESTSRQAMSEMRHMLGVLNSSGDGHADLTPQPGLDQLPRLLQECQGLGQAVTLTLAGSPYPLPPGVDLVAYRIVQESLTNARKHTTTGQASLEIVYSEHAIKLRISNTLSAGDTSGDPYSGHGLIGMRERVRLYAGNLTTGPDGNGQFVVEAQLPVKPTEAA